jgi:hypothetical protein
MKHDSEDLPRFIQDIISAGPPRAGTGVNLWLFKLARLLHAFRSTNEIADVLRASTFNCGRPVTETEISRAITNSRSCAWQPGEQNPATARAHAWPELNKKLHSQIVSAGSTLADLFETSPSPLDGLGADAVIDYLFPRDALLCCGRTKSDFRTLPREAWRGKLAAMQFIVPSPMRSKWGVTKEGKKSQHCLDNTGPRRFLVIEQDKGTLDEQAAILLHLTNGAPLVLAVFSGSKSLHGWFYVSGQREAHVEAFMRKACTLGADPATWLRSQFCRMPAGTRDNGKPQTLYFLNPRPIK